jgi:acetylornithine deacetylase/succinyl-diaminopimelate desuccinylase-like protein
MRPFEPKDLERVVDEIIEFAAIPAPTFAEESRLAWIEHRLAGLPGDRSRDVAGNLVWRWGSGRRHVLVMAHVDTVFPMTTSLEIERRGGELVGPGVGDNAAAVIVAIAVVERLLDECRPAAGALAFTVCEEGEGNLRGAREACRSLRPNAVIALEGHGLDEVVSEAVGSLRTLLRIEGPGGHSWVDRGTPSAVHELLAVGERLLAAQTPRAPVNLGLVRGGTSVNTIAADAELAVEVRSSDDASLADFEELLRGLITEPPLTLRMAPFVRRPAGRLDPSAPLLQKVRDVRAKLDLPDALGAGSTDANAAISAGIPALALGVTRGSGMHTTRERIEIAPLRTGADQLAGVLSHLLCDGLGGSSPRHSSPRTAATPRATMCGETDMAQSTDHCYRARGSETTMSDCFSEVEG